MHLDLHVSRFDWTSSNATMGRELVELAQQCEVLGVRTLSFMDHYFQMDWMAPAEDPMLEGYTALGFLAGATSSLRLRLLVTGITYRHPGLLAKIVTTLDVVSAGRAELGIGAAWYEREHVGLGVPFPSTVERFERLEETLQICQQMWSDNDGPFTGTHYQLAETLCRPVPVSKPHPRIVIGGGGERKTLRLVAQYADACNLFDFDDVAHKIDVLHQHCAEVGRDPKEIEITVLTNAIDETSGPSEVLEAAERLARLGVATMVVSAVGDAPGAWLEATVGPIMGDLAEVTPLVH